MVLLPGLLLLLAARAPVVKAGTGSLPHITLRYFDSRGRAEPVRLTLAALGLPWNEVVYARCGSDCPMGVEDWSTAKAEGIASGALSFGQVPSMSYTDQVTGHTFELVQTHAILRFLGRRHDFGGTCPSEEILIDIAMGGVDDMRAAYSKLVYNKQIIEDKSLLAAYKDEYLPLWHGHFERLLNRAGGDFLGGSAFSIADTLAFDILDLNLRVDPRSLDAFPTLDKFHNDIGHKHGLWEYLQGGAYSQFPQRRTRANGVSAFYDTPTRAPMGTGHIGPVKEFKPEL
jgi:glutathione S-transferase